MRKSLILLSILFIAILSACGSNDEKKPKTKNEDARLGSSYDAFVDEYGDAEEAPRSWDASYDFQDHFLHVDFVKKQGKLLATTIVIQPGKSLDGELWTKEETGDEIDKFLPKDLQKTGEDAVYDELTHVEKTFYSSASIEKKLNKKIVVVSMTILDDQDGLVNQIIITTR